MHIAHALADFIDFAGNLGGRVLPGRCFLFLAFLVCRVPAVELQAELFQGPQRQVAQQEGRLRLFFLLLREIKVSLMAAGMAAFGGVISEVGAVMMVGQKKIRGMIESATAISSYRMRWLSRPAILRLL